MEVDILKIFHFVLLFIYIFCHIDALLITD